jgi:hypothetical protein
LMPGLEEVMDAFSLDEGADEGEAEGGKRFGLGINVRVDTAGDVEDSLGFDAGGKEAFGGGFGLDEEEVGEFVFDAHAGAIDDEALEGAFEAGGGAVKFIGAGFEGFGFEFVAVPGGDFDHGGDTAFAGDDEGIFGVAGPAVEAIVIAGFEFAGGDPVDVSFFGAVVLIGGEEGEGADGVGAEGADEAGGDFGLVVAVTDGLPEEVVAVGGEDALEGATGEADTAEGGGGGIEEGLGERGVLREGMGEVDFGAMDGGVGHGGEGHGGEYSVISD